MVRYLHSIYEGALSRNKVFLNKRKPLPPLEKLSGAKELLASAHTKIVTFNQWTICIRSTKIMQHNGPPPPATDRRVSASNWDACCLMSVTDTSKP